MHVAAGVAVAGVGLIAFASTAPEHSGALVPKHADIALTATDPVTPYLDLISNTADNLGALIGNTLKFPILTQLFSDPIGSLQHLPNVLTLLLTIQPDITVDTSALPVSITGDIPPLPEAALAALSPLVTVGNALFGVSADALNVLNDPVGAVTAILGAPATLVDALLNGRDGIGIVGLTVPVFNGILVPGQSLDTPVALGQFADNTGLGDQTLGGLTDHFALGDKQLAAIATNLLDALGVGHRTPVDLADAIGLGDKQVTDVAAALLDALGIGQLTPVGLVDQLGGGSLTAAGALTNLLDALGLGDQNAIQLLDATGIGGVTVGSALASLLDGLGQSDLTLGEFLTEAGLADISVQDVIDAGQLSNTSVGSILSSLGFNLNLNDFISATGGDTTGISGGFINLMGPLNDLTLTRILAGQGLQPDTTLLDILSKPPADGGIPPADQTLGTLLSQDQTTFGELLTSAGLGGDDLDSVVDKLLGDTTVVSLLSSLGLDEQDLSGLLRSVPNDTTVSDLLAGLTWGNTDLDTIATGFFGTATVNSVLADLGLTNTTVSEILTGWGVADVGILNPDVGEFFGLVPALLNGLPEQIAQALGGGS